MSKSIVQREKECYICRYLAGEQGYYGELPSTGLHRHHIMFGTANRKKSEHYGLWVYLCVAHHEYGPDAVHTNRNVRIFLCQIGQQAFERKYSHEDTFARERLGWWSPVNNEQDYAIDRAKWKACVSDQKKPEGKTAYGVKFSADGSVVALCGAVCPEEGAARISLIEFKATDRGIRWLADWLNERYQTASCVVVDGRNGVEFLIEKITSVWRNRQSIVRPSGKDVIAAASQLVQEINEQTVTWYKYQEVLNESAITSVKRAIAGGWGFGGENSTPIEAAALALWGCRTSKRNPTRKMRIG